jgi:hypothetical protein
MRATRTLVRAGNQPRSKSLPYSAFRILRFVRSNDKCLWRCLATVASKTGPGLAFRDRICFDWCIENQARVVRKLVPGTASFQRKTQVAHLGHRLRRRSKNSIFSSLAASELVPGGIEIRDEDSLDLSHRSRQRKP